MKSDEFIREVDEELQRDRLAALWKAYGAYAIGAAVIIVAATAAQVGWTAWQESEMQAQGAAFDAARGQLASGKLDAAADAYTDIAGEHGGGPAAVARLRAAFALQREGDIEGAGEALAGLAASSDADPILRELAELQALAIRIDDDDPASLIDALEPLSAADKPWRHTARELRAAAALRAGDEDLAAELLTSLTEDATTPQSLRGRAAELLAAIGRAPEGGSQ